MRAEDSFCDWLADQFGLERARSLVLGLRVREHESVRFARAWLESGGMGALLTTRTRLDRHAVLSALHVIRAAGLTPERIMRAKLRDFQRAGDNFTWRLHYRRPVDLPLSGQLLDAVLTLARFGRESVLHGTTPLDQPLLIRSASDIRPWSTRMIRYALCAEKGVRNRTDEIPSTIPEHNSESA